MNPGGDYRAGKNNAGGQYGGADFCGIFRSRSFGDSLFAGLLAIRGPPTTLLVRCSRSFWRARDRLHALQSFRYGDTHNVHEGWWWNATNSASAVHNIPAKALFLYGQFVHGCTRLQQRIHWKVWGLGPGRGQVGLPHARASFSHRKQRTGILLAGGRRRSFGPSLRRHVAARQR